ncbi:glycosyl hydrolase family 3 N terminal domain-containing protein [Plectosphaerella plurivora]|uniref:Beta-glucosidase cel3A n=1 Tax=Plectosphaerella plurivora TaxID=936078 RepID=A0A9P8VDJ0_9PEZI|nr:glycosyl hydrolase family 3 N terminal domain-containing protein [Plectosphaerella plurivora]
MSFLKASLLLLAATAAPATSSALLPRDPVPPGYVAVSTYPTPHGGWDPDWVDSYARAKAMVDRMTLAEKTNITSGSGCRCVGNTGSAERVGFPQLCLSDGATGLNSADNVTAFPSGITTGATFDKRLMYQRGVALGKEFRGKGSNIWLGPSVGPLGRKPLGGRNWEGFGSDPVLQAKAAALSIKGVQEQGVIATIKHLIGNEQEMYRMYNPFQEGISSNIDDRVLHELYLWPFAEGIRAGSGAVMTAYNAVNGTASVQQSYTINGLLKNELGFQGLAMSDWFSHMPSGVQSAIAGLDLNMPGDTQVPLFGYSYWMYDLTRSVLNGSVPMDRINDMATRVVATWMQLGQDKGFPKTNFHSMTYDAVADIYPAAWPWSPRGVVNEFVKVQADHHLVAREVARDAITMLKNADSLLPIAPSRKIKVFGTAAQTNPDGPNACSFRSCNKGVLGMGWGSGVVDYMYIDDPISAIRRRAANVEFYARDNLGTVPTPADDDVAIVFITSAAGENSFTVEGNNGDRNKDGLKAWHGGDKLVRDAAAKYKNVIVVVQTVGPILVEEWIDLPSVKGLLFQHLPGQEAGESLTAVLFGDVSPSGHLPYSITKAESDLPDSLSKLIGDTNGQPQDTFSEGLYIDYRYLNKVGTKPRFAFGSGLSYTSFSFSKASVASVVRLTSTPPAAPPRAATLDFNQAVPAWTEGVVPAGFNKVFRYLYSWCTESEAKDAVSAREAGKKYPYPQGYSTVQPKALPASGRSGGNPTLWDVMFRVSLTVTNTGTSRAGKASAQLYVQFPSDSAVPDTPIIQLRDFEKTAELAPGQSTVVTLEVTRKDLSVWDTTVQNWVVPAPQGRYKLWIGDASDRLFLACYTDTQRCEGGLSSPV